MEPIEYARVLEEKLETLFDNPENRDQARKILLKYGKQKTEPEADRVRLAILKLSGADLACLQETMKNAKQDYREIIGWAEFPSQTIAGSLAEGSKKDRLVQSDLAQYQEWIESNYR